MVKLTKQKAEKVSLKKTEESLTTEERLRIRNVTMLTDLPLKWVGMIRGLVNTTDESRGKGVQSKKLVGWSGEFGKNLKDLKTRVRTKVWRVLINL